MKNAAAGDQIFTLTELQQRPVAVIGLGQIGMSWAVYFAAQGFAVRATDPAADAVERTRAYVHKVWPVLADVGLVVADASPGRISFHATVAETVTGCGWIQENAPEIESLKIDLLAQIDAAADAQAIIASSTSALAMSVMQSKCVHPQRCLMAHPFNPPHLVPLVELVGGKATAARTLDIAFDFYRAIGREPIRLRREIYGHVANRLQYVLFNEAARLVLDGVATVEDVDRAITCGPGMRWPFVGPFMTFHMAGGEAGMAGAFAKFAARDALSTDRSKRISLGADERQQLHEGACEAQQGVSMQALETRRDRLLVELLKVKAEIAARAG
ncbi:3-hydroxyacyl-CoA dehydrogenase [Bordetella holmesii]|uniref:3-hydroxyacyl-CoA dehydrogenase, C-terminal domain protein n=2 Tax=Bordetella holmesii TaxID=35814 RepID=A0ABP3BK13_9BORD|nr:3-hydroxyacyl-CoA dehydrogenase NAD-binding domain-containing protein [Bordetella holmesii]AHV91036.1 3-hydroxyacyl-CoA dehydrogenase, C-terminal domain protein [Bordetella holmesii ATCC 51541]AIT25266.1 3-hydroxyacyl-CoA dehydrogenase, C-terminal domain protein [Bordetella holmesii 44057]AMD44482.1 3-hydroxyacyl-CoA dehydrogenase [Bordetella holmesii H558]EWM45829.1 3-hydroxyacyl-CoA dehydrogenase, C-terminal domain protein [Bordetella holmesii 70147]EWM48889.1 3-hydroxyacyl-CoA dehydrogen